MENQESAGRRNCRFLTLAVLLLTFASEPVLNAATKGYKMPVVPKWSRFEKTFRSTLEYSNPLQDASLTVLFTSPLGEVCRVPGFWDGGRTWRVRFSPWQPGHWTFTTICSDPMNEGLHGQTSDFMCTSVLGQSRFDQHGLVQVSRDHRLELSDHTPFFWVADNAWSGARASVLKDWEVYAQLRLKQGFNTSMWVATPGLDDRGEPATTGFPERIGINPDFFRRMDAKVAALANAGILSAIVPFSDTEWGANAGVALNDEQMTLLVRYIVARWGADPVVWVIPAGRLAGQQRPWKQIGNAVFGEIWHAPVMVYAGVNSAIPGEFRDQKWVDLFGFQPFEKFTDEAIKAAFGGPFATEWKQEPVRPLIAFTPVENSIESGSKRYMAEEIRRAAYWSVLMTGASGVSYGALGVQNWDVSTGTPGEAGAELPLWRKSMFLPGGKQMSSMGQLMNSLPLAGLQPDAALVATQPGEVSPRGRVVAARSKEKDLVVAYVPEARSVELSLDALPASPAVTWMNPRTGESSPAVAVVSGRAGQFPTPAAGDWVLVVRKGK